MPTISHQRKPSPWIVLAIASLGSAVAFIDATIVNIAFPDIARSFPGTPLATLSWVLNAYNIVFAAFLMAAAGLADLLGRRRVFVFGLALFTAGSLLCAVAPSEYALIAFRIIQALGAAFLVPAALALVLQAFPPARRSHGVALLSAVGAAAAGLGPSLGGLLITAASWRLVFLVNIPIGVAAMLLARRRLAESWAPGRRRIPDLPGTLLLATAVGALVLGVVKGQEWGWASARIIGCLAVALAGGAVVIWRCLRHRSPVLDLSLLRIRTVGVANAMMVIGAAGYYGYTLSNVLFLTGVWRYSVLQAGLALTIGPVVAVVVAGPASRLAQRIGPRPVLVAGALLWGGAVLWLVERVGPRPDFAGQWLPGMILLGIGAGTAFPNLAGTAVASAPGRSFATATGLNSVARQVGAALGVAVVVAIIGTPTPATAYPVLQHAWTFGAICLFAAGLGCLLVGHHKPAESPVPVPGTPHESGNGRSPRPSGGAQSRRRRIALALARNGLALAERAAPGLGARAAVRMLMTLPRAVPGRAASVPEGDRQRVNLPGSAASSIVTEAWGEGPAVYLLHGWGGDRTSWRRFVGPLTRAGFRAVTLDAPGHGDSDPGAYGPGRTLLPEMITALRVAAGHHGPAHAVVAHSMGGLAAAVACLDGLPAARLVLISPMPDVPSAIQVFAEAAGAGERIRARMPRTLERLVRVPLSHFDAVRRSAEEETLPAALIIHDGGDRKVPFGLGARLAAAWPSARLHVTHGLGHHRILHDERVIAASVDFLMA